MTGRRREREVRRKALTGANAWRALRGDGGPADLKGNVMSARETPACLYGTETLAMIELQQQRLQVCENNWVRRIARITRSDRRRIFGIKGRDGREEELDRETGEEQV